MQLRELRKIAQTLSIVEDRSPGHDEIIAQAYREKCRPLVLGVTGPPGAGKSTLVDGLVQYWASAGERVAVLAIDPSSPYSGGAILGDRIRRKRSDGLDNVYFRSLSSRGHIGGLTDTTTEMATVLGTFEFSRIVIETVGAGQSDIEIHQIADCTLVLAVPGLGDGVQATKAGMMEIADIFAVNKADLPGADSAAHFLKQMLASIYMGSAGTNTWQPPTTSAASAYRDTPGIAAIARRHGLPDRDATTWTPPILRIEAENGTGIQVLAKAIDDFMRFSDSTGRRERMRSERAYFQILGSVKRLLLADYICEPGDAYPSELVPLIASVNNGSMSPNEAAKMLLRQTIVRKQLAS